MSPAIWAPPKGSDMLLAVALFAVVHLGVTAVYGVRHGGDTPLFLDGADRLLAGQPLVDRQSSYRGYVAFLAGSQAAGIGMSGVVVLQVLLGAAAAAAIFAIGSVLAGRAAGVAAAAFYTADADTNRWHQFILADSLFISSFAMTVLLTHRAAVRPAGEPLASAVAALVVTGLIRPEGWFLIPPAAGYVMLMRGGPVRAVASAVATAGVLWLLLSSSLSGNVQAIGPATMLQRGQTIWEFDGWRVEMPADASTTDGGAGSAVSYALRHPVATVTLMAARVAVYFANVRPYYSLGHNAVIVAWLVPVYAAAMYAAWNLGSLPLALWAVAAIGSQTLIVALTHAEYDGRYLAHVLPVVYALAGAGLASALAGERRWAVA